MALDSYANLKTAVSAWVERSSDTTYTGEVDTFIDLFEAKASRALIGDYRLDATTTLSTDSSGEAALPSDFQAIRSAIWEGAYDDPLEITSWARLKAINPYQQSGVPKYAAVQDQTIKTAPTKAGDLELNYWKTLPALTDSNTTNWLLTNAPDAYLLGCIAMGHLFNEDETRAAALDAKAMAILDEVRSVSDVAIYANAGVSMETPTP